MGDEREGRHPLEEGLQVEGRVVVANRAQGIALDGEDAQPPDARRRGAREDSGRNDHGGRDPAGGAGLWENAERERQGERGEHHAASVSPLRAGERPSATGCGARGCGTRRLPMSDWKKSSRELQERFDAALPEHPAVARRKMFGYPCAFVNDNFFSGLFEESVVVRLPGGMHEEFAETRDAAVFNPMPRGKGMTDWWLLPVAVSESDKGLTKFLAAAFAEVVRLPPKVKKPAAKKKPRGA